MVRHLRYSATPLQQAFWDHVFSHENEALRLVTI
jgi:hypothetical protein